MINFQEANELFIFDCWIKIYRDPSNTCEDLQKYLFLALEVTEKNFHGNNLYYIKPIGDNMEFILLEYCNRAVNKQDFDFVLKLLRQWYNTGVYDMIFLDKMRLIVEEKQNKFELRNDFNHSKDGNGKDESEENKRKFELLSSDSLLSLAVISSLNADIIK